jgi:nitrate reductase alpha subunit
LKRVGKRGEGKFEPITWDEAIDIITKEWIRIRDTYGPESRYVNYGWGVEALLNGTSLAKRLLRLDGGHLDYYNNYSTACTSYTTPYLYGTTKSGSSFDTLIDSKLIILWAHNPAETRFDNLMYWLRKAKRQGTEIIVIDPRKNATVDALGAEWIGIKPTTDSALMDAMAYVIYENRLHDQDFLDRCCIGFDKAHMPEGVDPDECYLSYLTGEKDGVPKIVEHNCTKQMEILEPQVMTPKRTDFGKAIRKQYEQGNIQMSRHDMTKPEPRQDGVSNTLTSVQKDNLVVEPRYRIRKLTPRECFRLMDVDDADIDKIQEAGISNSQQYKMAGNSIVVACLYHLFRKMFTEPQNEERQLTFW